MPSNNTGSIVRDLFKKYPDKIALLISPEGFRPHRFKFRYAIDNGAFKRFDEKKFFNMLDYTQSYEAPLFVAVPDVVGCHDRTIALWQYYQPKLKKYGYPLAFVAQDGCLPELVPDNADWIFVGGLDPWKINNIKNFVGLGRPVHVGRVNSMGRFKYCESLGVESIDGTGWMRFRDQDHYDLMDWFIGEQKQIELWQG